MIMMDKPQVMRVYIHTLKTFVHISRLPTVPSSATVPTKPKYGELLVGDAISLHCYGETEDILNCRGVVCRDWADLASTGASNRTEVINQPFHDALTPCIVNLISITPTLCGAGPRFARFVLTARSSGPDGNLRAVASNYLTLVCICSSGSFIRPINTPVSS